MKKFIILLLLSLSLFGSNTTLLSVEKQIIKKILYAVVPGKKIINVYFQGSNIPKSIKTNKIIHIVKDYKEADVIIVEQKNCKQNKYFHKPIIVLDYNLLNKCPNAIGAYFWQKGRPNIVMIEPRIKKESIKLPDEFKIYLESRVW